MKNNDRSHLGMFLEELRGGKPLREIAIKCGLSHTYIRDLELGINRKTKAPINPTPETLKRLSEAYNYSYDDLMERAGYVEENNSLAAFDEFVNKTLKEFKKDKRTTDLYGEDPFSDVTIGKLESKDKIELFMAITDNLENFRVEIKENGERELVLGVEKHPTYELEDENFADEINLTYKGMELTKFEKLEFLSIARAIFGARREMKEKG